LAATDWAVIDGAGRGLAWLARAASVRLRSVQNGYIRLYALAMLAGVVVLLAYLVLR
jgi:hypothetical protein